MADAKISALTAVTTPDGADEFAVNDAGTSKKITLGQIDSYMSNALSGTSGAVGPGRTTLVLTANSADNTTVTQAITHTLTGVGVGTWRVKATLVFQAAATTTGIGIVLNHTGTVTRFVSNWIHITTGGAAATGVSDQATEVAAGHMVEGKAERVKNTRTSFTVGVDTANADQLAVMDAVIVVTVTGSVTLSIASEIAASAVRLMAGSILELDKVA